MATTSRSRHFVLFPFPGHSHLAGFLALARLLLRQNLPDAAVTLVSTPGNIAALRASPTASETVSMISFHALPFVPSDHGLPAGCESMSSLPNQAFIDLLVAFESLEPPFDDYISGLVGEEEDACVIADPFVAWTVGVARRRGCAHAVFVTCGAFGTAILHALFRNYPAALPLASDDMFSLPEHPELVFHRTQLSPLFYLDDGKRDRRTAFYRRLLPHGYRTDAVLVNTAEEFEPKGLAMVRRTLGKVPVWPIGPLVRGQQDTKMAASTDGGVLRWLDSQAPASVLYISFGSQNTIQQKQMFELAAALQSTSRPFVWAIRPPIGFDIAGEFRDEWLPVGFEERARAGNRGVLVRGWAPQPRVLAHGATGAFLSHCGWNSVLESLSHGVPIIGWPLSAEQFYNVKMLVEEWRVCVEVARGNLESSTLDRSKLVEVLESVMGDTADSAQMRRRVMEVQEVMNSAWAWAEQGGSSRTALHGFLRAVRLQ